MLHIIAKILFGFSISVMFVWALIGFYRHVKRERARKKENKVFTEILGNDDYLYSERVPLNPELNN